MFKYLAAEAHLFPNVVVGKEASELSFSQWATMIGVTVAREHVDAHSMNLTDVHRSEVKEHISDIMTNNSCVKCDRRVLLSLNRVNLLSIYSCDDLA